MINLIFVRSTTWIPAFAGMTIKETQMINKNRLPTHPGEILNEEFLVPLDITQSEFAKSIGIPLQRVNTIINGKRGITAETALLFARRLKTTAEFWMSLQNVWDLYEAAKHLKSAA